MVKKVATQDSSAILLGFLDGIPGVEPYPVGIAVPEKVKKDLFLERLPTAREILAQFFYQDLASVGIVPEEVDLNGWHGMKFKPLDLSLAQLNRIPAEAQTTFFQILGLPTSGYFTKWGVLEEIPPPAPPPAWRRDPWLAFQVGNRYFGVYHWD